METIVSLFVGRPINILVIALVFLAAWFALKSTGCASDRRPQKFLVVAAAWTINAFWEWVVITRTPEANIRVDLMVIWPILLFITIWFSVRALRRVEEPEPKEKQ